MPENELGIVELHCYLSALDSAAHAIEQALALRAEPQLQPCVQVLRQLLDSGEAELQQRYAQRPSTATERRGLVLAWPRKA